MVVSVLILQNEDGLVWLTERSFDIRQDFPISRPFYWLMPLCIYCLQVGAGVNFSYGEKEEKDEDDMCREARKHALRRAPLIIAVRTPSRRSSGAA
jgi:hypothetical protein